MTQVEVLESYLDQRIEQALEVCDALSAEYGTDSQLQVLKLVRESLLGAANLTEAVRLNEGYDFIEVDTESNPTLAQDIEKLQDKILNAHNFFLELRNRHGELGGWEMVDEQLNLAWSWTQCPIELLPEEAE